MSVFQFIDCVLRFKFHFGVCIQWSIAAKSSIVERIQIHTQWLLCKQAHTDINSWKSALQSQYSEEQAEKKTKREHNGWKESGASIWCCARVYGINWHMEQFMFLERFAVSQFIWILLNLFTSWLLHAAHKQLKHSCKNADWKGS